MEGQSFFGGGAPQQQQQYAQVTPHFQMGYQQPTQYPFMMTPSPSAQQQQQQILPLTQAFFNPWDPPPMPVLPPSDVDLQKRIDKLAEYAAKNGPEFEALMKEKQKDNPAYAFLFGADGHSYYRYKLYVTINPHFNYSSSPAPLLQQQPHHLPLQQQQQQPHQHPHQPLPPPPPPPPPHPPQFVKAGNILPFEVAAELHGILENLNATKESIKSAKQWFLHRFSFAPAFAEALRDRVLALDDVERQLHVLYLANDILFESLQHRVNANDVDNEAIAFAPFLGSMLAAIYGNPQISESDKLQLEKMLQFWCVKEVYDADAVKGFERAMKKIPESAAVRQPSEQQQQLPQQLLQHLQPSDLSSQGHVAASTPYPLFPPGLIPGMVRKMQIGSGVPYSALSPLDIPTVIPPSTSSHSAVMERVRKFYKEIGEVDPLRKEGEEEDDVEDDVDVEVERVGARIAPPVEMQVDSETGTLPDGTGMRCSTSGRLGLGAAADPNEMTQYDDVYTSYRKQRSTTYHTSLSARAAAGR